MVTVRTEPTNDVEAQKQVESLINETDEALSEYQLLLSVLTHEKKTRRVAKSSDAPAPGLKRGRSSTKKKDTRKTQPTRKATAEVSAVHRKTVAGTGRRATTSPARILFVLLYFVSTTIRPVSVRRRQPAIPTWSFLSATSSQGEQGWLGPSSRLPEKKTPASPPTLAILGLAGKLSLLVAPNRFRWSHIAESSIFSLHPLHGRRRRMISACGPSLPQACD